MLSDEEAEHEGIGVFSRLFGFLFLGITLVFVGLAVLVGAYVVLGGSGSFGGVILIGPIPIVFGAGPEAGWLIAISIILTVTSVVFFWL